MEYELSIIVPTKDRVRILRRTLEELCDAVLSKKIEVIVVNDSDLAIPEIANGLPIKVSLINNKGSGVASARNFGAQHATAPILLFLDDDMWLAKGILDKVISFHRRHERSVLNIDWQYPKELEINLNRSVFGRYLKKNGFTSLKGWNKGKNWEESSVFETDGITSQNLSIRRSTFEEVGGYNESFPFAGFEDHEFSRRLGEGGVRMYIDTTTVMYHNEEDRQSLSKWLDRKYRSGITRRVAVDMGFYEISLNHNSLKILMLSFISVLRPFLLLVASNAITNRISVMDIVTHKIIGYLLASAIYEGYSKDR